jgi:hypothetical protein
VWLVATATIALAIVPSTASAAATRADYVSQVDQICATTTKGFGRLGPRLKTLFGPKAYAPPHMQGSSSPTKKQLRRLRNRFVNRLARVLEILNQSLSSTTEQIALVTPAPGDEDAVAQWIAGLRQYVTFTASTASSQAGKRTGLPEAGDAGAQRGWRRGPGIRHRQLPDLAVRERLAARRYRFRACSSR